MNRNQVLDSVRYIMSGPRAFEAERLERIAEAMKPWTPMVRGDRWRRPATPKSRLSG